MITAWTIRIALIALLASVVLGMIHPWRPVSPAIRRAIWSLGGLVFLAHIAAGMHFYHGWDHSHAYEDTAQQTYETLGVRFGGGIYINHLMAVVWFGDMLWWWLSPRTYSKRSPRWEQAIVGFFLFIAFNGLIVFKQGPLRIAGIAAFSGLAILGLIMWLIAPPSRRLETSEP